MECPLSTRDLVDKILQFCEILAGVKLYTYQSLFVRRIIESVIINDSARITVLCARQVGKSEAISACAAGLATILPVLASEFDTDKRLMPFGAIAGATSKFSIGIFAPIEKQAKIPYERTQAIFASEHGMAVLSDLGIRVTASRGDRLSLSTGAMISCTTASPQSKIEGGTHHLVILEEAQLISRAKIDKEILPMLASTAGSVVSIGTAWESRGGFHTQIQQNLEQHAATGVRDHFEFPYDIVLVEKRKAYEKDGNPWHLRYEKFIDSEIKRLGGTENIEFKMNFKCAWNESRVIAVNKGLFLSMGDPNVEAFPRKDSFQVAGLDIGKISDSTVLTTMSIDLANPVINEYALPGADSDKQIYYPKRITDWLQLGGSFEGDTGQYKRLIEHLMMSNVKILVIDSTAIGDPIFERIQDMVGDSIVCVSFKFSSASKSLLYKYYLQELHARRISYAAGPNTVQTTEFMKFKNEHLNLDKVVAGGYTLCQAPDGEHDDYPDSAALACWAEKLKDEVMMPTIEVSSTPLYTRSGRASGRANPSEEMGMPSIETSGSSGHRYARRR